MYREVERCSEALKSYITSTYHISDPGLVELRERLLDRVGAISQQPFIESTARYKASREFSKLD